MGKKFFTSIFILGVLFFSVSISASAEEGLIEDGGWSSDGGYYQNNNVIEEVHNSSELTPFSVQGPPHHVAENEVEIINGIPKTRVIGTTKYPGNTYHYTQAWHQNRITGTKSGSNRVWGYGNTTARSDWRTTSIGTAALHKGMTSYGR